MTTGQQIISVTIPTRCVSTWSVREKYIQFFVILSGKITCGWLGSKRTLTIEVSCVAESVSATIKGSCGGQAISHKAYSLTGYVIVQCKVEPGVRCKDKITKGSWALFLCV